MHAKFKQSENLRYERKFAVNTDDVESLLFLVKLHPGLFSESYDERRVNSIYFDTDDYSYYQDTAFGRTDRQKVRVRWYGNNIATICDGKVEIKSKSGYLGSKDAFDLGSFATGDFLSNYRAYINAAESLTQGHKQLFSFLRPTIIVSYLRQYFVSADRNFRLTLDYRLRFYDVRTGFNPLRKVDSTICVLELKYQSEHDTLARTISSSLPNRFTRSSKYVIGLEAI